MLPGLRPGVSDSLGLGSDLRIAHRFRSDGDNPGTKRQAALY